MAKYHQGRFKPKYPHMYKGDPTNIIYRSGWELKFLQYMDGHPDIEWYSSEEIVIPYISPVDNRPHRYFVDFVLKKKNGETIMIEIKPFKQTQPPLLENRLDSKGKTRKAYVNEVMTYGVNQAKWKAAQTFCKAKGWRFAIFTEKELNIKGKG